MKTWLVVNAFLNTGKYSEIHEWLCEACKKHGIEIEQKTNAQLLSEINVMDIESTLFATEEKPDFVIFWDKDVRLARLLEKAGLKLYNSAQAIEICDDKSRMHQALSKEGVEMPKTYFAPLTYPVCGYCDFSFLENVEKSLGFPMVVKECFGSFGAQVYLVKDHQELKILVEKLKTTPFIMQECINESLGRDIRINMVGNCPVASMERYNEHDFRANISNGGSMRPYTPTKQEIAMAQRVMEVLKLDFAGVDILFGKEGRPILCEVNSNAHFRNIYDCTNVNVADAIVEYIIQQM